MQRPPYPNPAHEVSGTLRGTRVERRSPRRALAATHRRQAGCARSDCPWTGGLHGLRPLPRQSEVATVNALGPPRLSHLVARTAVADGNGAAALAWTIPGGGPTVHHNQRANREGRFGMLGGGSVAQVPLSAGEALLEGRGHARQHPPGVRTDRLACPGPQGRAPPVSRVALSRQLISYHCVVIEIGIRSQVFFPLSPPCQHLRG